MDDEPILLPIDGVLDLHTFKPSEVKDLVLDYLAECLKRGIFQVNCALFMGKALGICDGRCMRCWRNIRRWFRLRWITRSSADGVRRLFIFGSRRREEDIKAGRFN